MKREHCIKILRNMLVIHTEKEPWVRYVSGRTGFWCLDPKDYMTEDLVFYQREGFAITIPYERIQSLVMNCYGDIVIAFSDWGSDMIIHKEALEPKPKDKVHLPSKPYYDFRRLCIKEGLPISKTATSWFSDINDGLEMIVRPKPDGRKYKVLLAKYGGSRQAGLLSVKTLDCYGRWETVLRYATAEEALEFVKKEGRK